MVANDDEKQITLQWIRTFMCDLKSLAFNDPPINMTTLERVARMAALESQLNELILSVKMYDASRAVDSSLAGEIVKNAEKTSVYIVRRARVLADKVRLDAEEEARRILAEAELTLAQAKEHVGRPLVTR